MRGKPTRSLSALQPRASAGPNRLTGVQGQKGNEAGSQYRPSAPVQIITTRTFWLKMNEGSDGTFFFFFLLFELSLQGTDRTFSATQIANLQF